MSRAFLDSNVLVYAFTMDAKALRARALLKGGGTVSVQVLNEVANVARRKLRFDWAEVHDILRVVRSRCEPPQALTDALHREGLRLSERYTLSVYDGLITAAALNTGCDLLWSEDMHDGLVIEQRLRIVNPFVPVH